MGRRDHMIDTLGRQQQLLEVLVTQLRHKTPQPHADCLFCKRRPSLKRRQKRKPTVSTGSQLKNERISGPGQVSLYSRAEMRAVHILGGYTRPAAKTSKKKGQSRGAAQTGGVL